MEHSQNTDIIPCAHILIRGIYLEFTLNTVERCSTSADCWCQARLSIGRQQETTLPLLHTEPSRVGTQAVVMRLSTGNKYVGLQAAGRVG